MVRYLLVLVVAGGAIVGGPRRGHAQAFLADDIVLLSKGQGEQEKARKMTHLGSSPGAGGPSFRSTPGGLEPTLGEDGTRARRFTSSRRDVLSAASGATSNRQRDPGGVLARPSAGRPARAELPQYGQLDMPTGEEEGPADGLTIEATIELLVRNNLDLRAKFQEIPQAQADILSAGLRGNPLVFGSADNVPYGSYSPQRPGETGYSVTVIQPWDVNQKRRVRVLAAQRAKRVLDAQYQDAVRLEIDTLYNLYVDVLSARETVRYAEANLAGLDEILRATEAQVRGEEKSSLELDRLRVQQVTGRIGLEEARAAFDQARQALVTQLNLPAESAQQLALRSSIRATAKRLPPTEELLALARVNRPDLMAFRLGVQRARADVQMEKAERIPDMFVLYTPYSFRNNAPTGGQNATSWSVGVLASVPIFNQNQGNIRRAEINVSQSRIELASLERQIEGEVRQAIKEHEAAVVAVERYERDALPAARAVRDKTLELFRNEQQGLVAVLNAKKEFSEVIRQYRDALIRHRRATLRVNTAVALRMIP